MVNFASALKISLDLSFRFEMSGASLRSPAKSTYERRHELFAPTAFAFHVYTSPP
jgi:hypothetical protein